MGAFLFKSKKKPGKGDDDSSSDESDHGNAAAQGDYIRVHGESPEVLQKHFAAVYLRFTFSGRRLILQYTLTFPNFATDRTLTPLNLRTKSSPEPKATL